jgi:hypothetical protein
MIIFGHEQNKQSLKYSLLKKDLEQLRESLRLHTIKLILQSKLKEVFFILNSVFNLASANDFYFQLEQSLFYDDETSGYLDQIDIQ